MVCGCSSTATQTTQLIRDDGGDLDTGGNDAAREQYFIDGGLEHVCTDHDNCLGLEQAMFERYGKDADAVWPSIECRGGSLGGFCTFNCWASELGAFTREEFRADCEAIGGHCEPVGPSQGSLCRQ